MFSKSFLKVLTLSRQIFYSSNLKALADDNFKFDENDRKFFKRVESTAGKGEIARNKQLLLFRQCFQKTCTRKNQCLFVNELKSQDCLRKGVRL